MADTTTQSTNTGQVLPAPSTYVPTPAPTTTQPAPAPTTAGTPAPAVITSAPATDQMTTIQQATTDKTNLQQVQSAAKQNLTTTYDAQGNMVITGGVMPNGSQYQQVIPKGSPNYIPDPVKVKALQDQISQKQAQLKEAQDNANLTATATGTTPATSTTPTYSNQSAVTPPSNIDYTTTSGQAEWYQQDPKAFTQWAKDQGISEADLSNVKYEASINQFNSDSAQIKATLQQLNNGTYPLTPDQQALLDATKNMWDNTVLLQGEANKTYQSAVGMASARSGGQYDPLGAAAAVQRATNQGLIEVHNLQVKETQVLADLKKSFDDENFNRVTKLNDQLISIDKGISDNLKSIHDEIVTQNQRIFDNNMAIQKATLDKIVADHNMSYQDKQIAISQAQASETARHNAAEELISRETAAKGTYQVVQNADGTQSIFNTSSGQIVGTPNNSVVGGQMASPYENGSYQPNQTGVPLLDTNMKQTPSGVWYVDGTNLSGKQAQAVQLQAAQRGIPYMGAPAAAALNKINDVKQNLSAIDAALGSSLAKNAFTNIARGPLNTIEAWTQINPELSSFNTWRSAAIGALQGLAGGSGSGLRINQAEIAMSIKNDIPNITDTQATAKAKLLTMDTMLNNQEKSLFGPSYDVMKAEQSSTNSTDALKKLGNLSPSYQKQIQAIQQQNPGFTDDEIMQVFNPNITQ